MPFFNPQPKPDKIVLKPFEYSKMKTQLWRDQDFMCARCFKFLPRQQAHFHHHIKKSQGGGDIINGKVNGEILCWECHRKVHDEPAKETV